MTGKITLKPYDKTISVLLIGCVILIVFAMIFSVIMADKQYEKKQEILKTCQKTDLYVVTRRNTIEPVFQCKEDI